MRKRLILVVLLLLLLTACGGKMVPPPAEDSAPPPETPEHTEPPEEPEPPPLSPEEALLENMTLEEKVGQLFFVHVPTENAVEDIAAYHLGGYLLFGRDTRDKTASELIQAIASYQTAALNDTEVPMLIGVDEEGGTVVRVSSNPHLRSRKFSNPRKLWEAGPDAVRAEAHEKDLLLKALGFNVNLNPVADVSASPRDFIYERTTGGGPDEAKAYVSLVTEVQSQDKIGSVLKHFPGYGNNLDTHTGAAVDERPMETFLEQDFLPFQAGIATGAMFPPMPAVLVSHNIVTCMDPNLPASLSPEVHRILREELGFDGVVMTDDLNMSAVTGYAKSQAPAVLSLQAGNDLIVATDYRTEIPKVLEAVENGELDEALIDAACLRVLRWKRELGLLELSEDGETLAFALS